MRYKEQKPHRPRLAPLVEPGTKDTKLLVQSPYGLFTSELNLMVLMELGISSNLEDSVIL